MSSASPLRTSTAFQAPPFHIPPAPAAASAFGSGSASPASSNADLPHVLCDVCCEHVSPSVLRGCVACSHRYCAPCVDKYWTGAIYSGNHARLLCMYGGCGVFATDGDIANVVEERTFRKMLYFRSRDRYHSCPDARWCARDMCWEYLGRHTAGAMADTVVACARCSSRTCVKCERLVAANESNSRSGRHVCASRKKNKAHSALFSLWATVHTKACPACAARIQRNHGCSHMTCTRCSSYFCWRCKGFLNNGCPLPGRACICDRVMTAAAYSGLAVAGVIGSPVIVTAVLIGGAPYIMYRVLKARRERQRTRRSPAGSGGVSGVALHAGAHLGAASLGMGANSRVARLGRAPGRVLQPDEMVVQEDEDFDSGSTRLTAFSDVMVAEARGLVREEPRPLAREVPRAPARRVRAVVGSAGLEGTGVVVVQQGEEKGGGETEETEDPFIGADGFESTSEDGEEEIPGASVENCKVNRPFVLERRRGSVSGARVARRAVL